MQKIIKDMLTPPWLEKILPRPVMPITEATLRPFISLIWPFFGLDSSDPAKEALIQFCLEFGRERKEYNLKTLEPITWAYMNGFDSGYEAGYHAGYQKHVKAFEEATAENSEIIEENRRILRETRQECDSIIADTEALYDKAKAHLDQAMRLQGLNDEVIHAVYGKAHLDRKMSLQEAGTDAESIAIRPVWG